jgi:hypothetical protein
MKTILTDDAFLQIVRKILKRSTTAKEADQLLDALIKRDTADIIEALKEKAATRDSGDKPQS